MTNQQHPITPPPELVEQWYETADNISEDVIIGVANRAAQWGADQELEACCEWTQSYAECGDALRLARRSRPPSLKEQALLELGDIYNDEKIDGHAYNTIRSALEQLND